MVPVALAIQAFRSFTADTVFRFPRGPGFYFLSGLNKANPALGGNATGKSSVWDALCWACYGKTARGLKAGAVANWAGEGLCSVCFEFKAGGVRYALTRTWGPGSLTLKTGPADPAPVTQEQVDTLLGLDYAGFLYVVLMGQFGTFFFDLEPTAKLNLFSEALGLGRWAAAADAARDRAVSARARAVTHGEAAARLTGVTEAIKEQQRGLRVASLKAAEQMADEAAAAQQALTAAGEALTLYQGKLLGGAEGQRKAAARAEAAERKIAPAQAAYNAAHVAVIKLEKDRDASKGALRDLAALMARLKALRGDCPACLQPVGPRHVKHAARTLKLRAEFEEAQLAKLEEKLDVARAAADAAHKVSLALGSAYNKAKFAVTEAQTLNAARNQKLVKLRAALQAAEARVAAAKASKDPLAAQLKQVRLKLTAAREDLAVAQAAAEKANRFTGIWEGWAKHFKDLRLWIIEEALVELELEVNNSLAGLGLEGWAVKFDVERENSSGGITRGFQVLITNPATDKPVPWAAWCGGEIQRLRIAGAEGLANLVRNRRGITLPLEIWDEPTAHLSEEGIQDLLQHYELRAAAGRQVWLVDHRSLSFGGFTGVYMVVKDAAGSHFKE